MKPINLSVNECKVLDALFEHAGMEGCYGFAPLARFTKLERNIVRRCCRSLARKGLTSFERGLWSEGGEPAGSGYGLTREGHSLAAERDKMRAGAPA